MSSKAGSSVEERLAQLELRVQELASVVETLRDRVSRQEAAPLPASGDAPPADFPEEEFLPLPRPRVPTLATLFFQLGRSLLVVGGAFLVRAFTEGGLWPHATGVAIGLAYAVSTILLAGRAAKRASPTSGAFLGVTAVFIADPLIWEASTKFGVFSAAGSAAALCLLTVLCLVVARRFDLPALSWSAVVGFLVTGLALLSVKEEPLPLAVAFVAFGGLTLWSGDERLRWRLLCWPAAIAADGVVAWLALTISAPAWQPAVFTLALALLSIYLASFAVAIIALDRAVTPFVWVQTAAALLCGLGGAVHIANASGWGTVGLGVGSLAAAAASYWAALAPVAEAKRREGRAYTASLALVLTICGGAMTFGTLPRTLLWCSLALASVWVDRRFEAANLRAHGAVYALAAASVAGLLAFSFTAWASAEDQPWRRIELLPVFVLLVAAGCWAMSIRRGSAGSRWQGVPGFFLGLLSVLGAGALLVLLLERLWEGDAGSPDVAARAAIRTGVLAAAALGLATARRRIPIRELAGLAILALAAGGAKLLVEDFPQGRPASLFVAFALYGTALILVPRSLRRRTPA